MDGSLPGSSAMGFSRQKYWSGVPLPSPASQFYSVTFHYQCVCVCSFAQSCPALCNHMDYSPPGSSAHGISQARILEWAAFFPSPGDLPNPGIEPTSLISPALASEFFTTCATWEASFSVFPPLPPSHHFKLGWANIFLLTPNSHNIEKQQPK